MATKITRKKTHQENCWLLTINEVAVGKVEAFYKTPTQRVWSGDIHVPLFDGTVYDCRIENESSAKQIIDHFEYGLKKKKPKVFHPDSPEAQVPMLLTTEVVMNNDPFAVSMVHNIDTKGSNGKKRSAEAQREYLLKVLDKRREQIKKNPMLDLLYRPRASDTRVSSKLVMPKDE